MLNKEYNHLLKCCKKIRSASYGITYTLDKILSTKGRSFKVSFDGVEYNLFPPSTSKELMDQEILKEQFLEQLLSKSYEQMIKADKDDDSWSENILVFAMGEPLENYQIEKIKEENIADVSDSNEKMQNGVALNEDSIYVQWQDENKLKFD